jgi:NADH:ubiquinone oxidoreductase subunit 3 (subunit A)
MNAPKTIMVKFARCHATAAILHVGVPMQSEWVYIGLFLVLGIIVPIVPLVLSRFVAPRKPNPIKQSTYECGIETVGESWVQFKAQYYIFALVFLVFDVETVFLFPWAISLDKLPLFAVVEGIIFISILIAGLVFAWRKGMLEWA